MAIIDSTLGLAVVVVAVVVVGILPPLFLAWATSTGALDRWSTRVADWCAGHRWRTALVLAVPAAVPLLFLVFLVPIVSGWTMLLLVALEVAVVWTLVSWAMRHFRDNWDSSADA